MIYLREDNDYSENLNNTQIMKSFGVNSNQLDEIQ